MKKVYVTKWALSNGIEVSETEDDTSKDHIVAGPHSNFGVCLRKPHWHLTRIEAARQAEWMRKKRIASLKRSLAKMKALKFS